MPRIIIDEAFRWRGCDPSSPFPGTFRFQVHLLPEPIDHRWAVPFCLLLLNYPSTESHYPSNLLSIVFFMPNRISSQFANSAPLPNRSDFFFFSSSYPFPPPSVFLFFFFWNIYFLTSLVYFAISRQAWTWRGRYWKEWYRWYQSEWHDPFVCMSGTSENWTELGPSSNWLIDFMYTQLQLILQMIYESLTRKIIFTTCGNGSGVWDMEPRSRDWSLNFLKFTAPNHTTLDPEKQYT